MNRTKLMALASVFILCAILGLAATPECSDSAPEDEDSLTVPHVVSSRSESAISNTYMVIALVIVVMLLILALIATSRGYGPTWNAAHAKRLSVFEDKNMISILLYVSETGGCTLDDISGAIAMDSEIDEKIRSLTNAKLISTDNSGNIRLTKVGEGVVAELIAIRNVMDEGQ